MPYCSLSSGAAFWRLPASRLALMLPLVLAGCGGGGGKTAEEGSSPPVPPVPADQIIAASQIGAGGSPFLFSKQEIAPVSDEGNPGSAANNTARIERIYFAQTHLLDPASPFFFLTANRPALIKVDVSGSGNAPSVSVEGSNNGKSLGLLYLRGPAVLPSAVSVSTPSKDDSFTVTLPAAWMQPGLALKVQAGAVTRTFSAAELKLGPAPAFSFVVADMLLFGDERAKPVPDGVLTQYLAGVPFSRVHFAKFPVPVRLEKFASPPRTDGQDGFGNPKTIPAVVMDRMSSATTAEKAQGKATPWSGFAIFGAGLSLLSRIQQANGMDQYTHWYGLNSGFIGGGLGGGVTAVGDDFGGIFFHEMGHTFDMPHWGDEWGSRGSAASRYPYAGDQMLSNGTPMGGGVGETWGYEQDTGKLFPPTQMLNGRKVEKQDAMQGGGGEETRNGVRRMFSMFSDFSGYVAYRYYAGAAQAQSGQVSYKGGMADYALRAKAGRPNFDPVSGNYALWNAASATYRNVDISSEYSPFPKKTGVPVYTLHGSYSRTTPEATLIHTPLRYTGNLKRLWDPTSPADVTLMKASLNGGNGIFWWGWDFVVQVEFVSGVKRHYVVQANMRGSRRDDPLDDDSFTHWAINIPDEGQLKAINLYYRPMVVRYDSDKEEGNLNDASQAITAANYMDKAVRVKRAVIQ